MNSARKEETLACVLGDLDMVRPLGLAGIGCTVVAPSGSPAFHSRYARKALPWDGGAQDPDRLVEVLLRFAEGEPAPPVLFYEEDAHLLTISRHRDRLRPSFLFTIADAELVETLVDKARFQALAERLELPVPATRRFDPLRDPVPGVLDLRFPVIVKPLTRSRAWDEAEGFGKAVPVDSPEELRALWPRLAAVGMDVLVQERVPGPESRIESYHVYVDATGAIAGEFTGRKIRTYPLAYGHSTALTITDEPDVALLGRRLVERLGLRGVAKFDFKRAPDGMLHLLEVNPRFNLWHHLGAKAGVNLPALVYADLLGLKRPATGRARAGARWCHITKDRLAARESGVSMAAWVPWMLSCEATSIAWHDPMPFLRNTLGRFAPARGPSEHGRDGRLAKT